MDVLYRRYSHPDFLLGNLIQMGQLSGFIDKVMQSEDDERQWELYCAAGYWSGKSFQEWKGQNLEKAVPDAMDAGRMGQILETSAGILHGFKPEEAED